MVYKLKAEIEDAFVTPEPVLSTFRFLEPNNLPEDILLISQYGKVYLFYFLKSNDKKHIYNLIKY